MKRKIFSKLLMVALVIAAVGSFVSCKDYDDDINNLQKQIDAKAAIAQIESLQSQLTAAQTAAQKAQTDATKALADAAAAAKTAGDAATAKALEDAIAKVNAAAEKAATENAAAIKAAADAAAAAGTDAAAAKTAADEAKAAAEKAAADAQKAIKDAIDALVIPTMPDLSGYATKGEVLTEAQIKALISQNAQAKGEYLTATTLSAALADLGISAGSGQVDLTPINNAIAAYKSAIEQLYSMVTSVELIGTWTGAVVPGAQRLNGNYNIGFIHGKQVTDEAFGNNEDKFFQFDEADQVKFKVGDDIRTNKNLLIRVNPTNATFTKDQIQLVDTKGNDLSEFIEITKVERYTGLITRSVDNTGLWAVQIKVKDGADKAAFNTRVYNGGELNDDNEMPWGTPQIVFAVAIKNTTDAEDATAARYVASTYDLVTSWTNYVPANYFDLDFVVTPTNDGQLFDDLANRWGRIANNNTGVAEDGILGENGRDRIFTNPELAWQVPAEPAAIPTDANTVAAGAALTADANLLVAAWPFDDRRLKNWAGNSFLEVDPGQTITLSNIDGYAQRYGYDARTKTYFRRANTTVEYYYVTLDLGNAVESAPSEFNAWKSYKIGGLNTMTKADESLDLVFDDPTLVGDYIGFRVYAVNYDGTLVDPDGRAFYVHVKGEAPVAAAVNVKIAANTPYANFTTPATWNQNAGKANITHTYETLTNISGSYSGSFGFSGWQNFWIDNTATNYSVSLWNNGGQRVRVYYQLLDKDGNVATNWKDIKSVRTAIDKPGYVLDGSTLPAIYLYGTSQNTSGTPTLNEINILVTKEMPTEAGATVVWRESLQPDENGVLTVYPRPWNAATNTKLDWQTANAPAMEKDLTQYVDNKEKFQDWVIAKKAGWGDTQITMNAVNGWSAISESSKINQTYDSYITYVYPNLSTYWDDATQTTLYNQDYTMHAWDGKVNYVDVIGLFTYGLNEYTYYDDATKKGTALNVKWLEIEDGTAVTHFWGDSKTAGAYGTNVNAFLPTLIKNTTTDANKRKGVNAGIVESAAYGNSLLLDWSTVSAATSLTAPVYDKSIYPGGITATLSGGNITSLISVRYNAATEMFTISRFVNTDGTYGDVPTGDVSGTITVKGKDSYKVNHTIVTIPITLRYNK